MEETSIFDKEFEQSIKVRRRGLLHIWLKLYLCGGILFGAFMFYTINEAMTEQEANADGLAFRVGYMVMLAFMVLYILKYVLLWLEVRAAIRWNWVVGGLNTLLITIVLAMSGSPWYLLMELVSVPYWIMLWKIQYRWEKLAMSGSLRHK